MQPGRAGKKGISFALALVLKSALCYAWVDMATTIRG